MIYLDEPCKNCKPNSPCHRHAGRNVRELNKLKPIFYSTPTSGSLLRKARARLNPFYSYDDWREMGSIQGRFSDN